MGDTSGADRAVAEEALGRAFAELEDVTRRKAEAWQRGDPDAVAAMEAAMRGVEEARARYDAILGEGAPVPTPPADDGPATEGTPLTWPDGWHQVVELVLQGALEGAGATADDDDLPFVDFQPSTAPWDLEDAREHPLVGSSAAGAGGRLVPLGADGTDSLVAVHRPDDDTGVDEGPVVLLSSEGEAARVVAADTVDFVVLLSLGWGPHDLALEVASDGPIGLPIPRPAATLRRHVSRELATRDQPVEVLLARARVQRATTPT